MDKQKVQLILQNIESSVNLLKLELEETDTPDKTVFKLEDLIHGSIDNYEPEYHEEE